MSTIRFILRILVRIPWTLALVIVAIGMGIYTKALWISAEDKLVNSYGYGLSTIKEGDFVSLVTGLFIAPAPWMYVMIIGLLLAGAGFIEYKYGAIKMLVTVFATHITAVLIVAGLLQLLTPTNWTWVIELSHVLDVGASNAAFGAVGAATAGLPILWRRRARLGITLYLIAMVLFSAAIWDLTHLAGFIVGLALGPWVVGRAYELKKPKTSKVEIRSFVSILIVFFGITHLVARVYPGNGGILAFDQVDSPEVGSFIFVSSLIFISFILAYGLYAGRLLAWRLMVPLCALLITATFLVPFTPVTILNLCLYSAILILLIVFRKSFRIKPDKYVQRRIYKRLAIVAVGLFVFNSLAVYGLRHNFNPEPNFGSAVKESATQVFGISSSVYKVNNSLTRNFLDSINIAWLVFVLLSLGALILTTFRARDGNKLFIAYDELLHKKGGSSISWMTRWKNMSYWMNTSRTAGFAYRLENNIAIVLSDPIGSKQAVVSVLPKFIKFCNNHGWNPIFYSVTGPTAKILSRFGYSSIQIGEDTVIDLKDLSFTGKSWQSVRSAVNRAEKSGIRMRSFTLQNATVGMRDQLTSIANGWVDDKSLPEMGFTLGTLKEAEDPEVRMHVAVDAEGTVHGMTSWMPIFKNNSIKGWTIDIMQRRLHDSTMPGVIEYLIAESAMTFKQEGYGIISLSAAPLVRSTKAINSIERMLSVASVRMEPYYGFKSLYNFKKKFQPKHEPLYLCYRDEARLPAISLAIGKAYMPDVSLAELTKAIISR